MVQKIISVRLVPGFRKKSFLVDHLQDTKKLNLLESDTWERIHEFFITERRCVSIVFAIKKKMQYYLDGCKFRIITDHNPLRCLRSNVISNTRLVYWALALQPCDFGIKHRSGKSHKNVYTLTRCAIEETGLD